MIEIQNKSLCSGCGACATACPAKCIEMQTDGEGFLYPIADSQSCIECGLCERVCPFLSPYSPAEDCDTYLLKNKEVSVRERSSSGGAFTLFAEYFCDNNGVVFGAALDEKGVCVHAMANTKEACVPFCGSKYVQSQLGDSFANIKKLLEEGRKVLFTGTPCQVAGLRHFLGKEYENLLCIDFICHGVPSPGVFALYFKGLEEQFGKIKTIRFRHKKKGWHCVSDMIVYPYNGHEIKIKNDLFLRGFLLNLYLRPSCYDCKANALRSGSDLTMADYWGAESKFPHLDDGLGLSLLIARTERGKSALDAIRDKAILEESDLQHAVLYNNTLFKSSRFNSLREPFFADYAKKEKSFQELARHYARMSSAPKTWAAITVKKIFGYRFFNRLWRLAFGKGD